MSMLYLTTFTLAAVFASAALYITLVEHPARLGLADGPSLAQWQPSYKRALPIQAGLAVLGSVLGVFSWQVSGDWPWLAGSVVLIANWPFTLLVILPTNKRLLAMSVRDAGAESRRLLVRWGGLHNVRSLLGAVATVLFGWGALIAQVGQ